MSQPVKHLPPWPAERALKVIAGRGKALILYRLYERDLRLAELHRSLPQLSQKVLIEQLRELELHGVVIRRRVLVDAVDGAPVPRMAYSATSLGRSLEPLLLALCEWGRHHALELDEADRLADCLTPAMGRLEREAAPRDSV